MGPGALVYEGGVDVYGYSQSRDLGCGRRSR